VTATVAATLLIDVVHHSPAESRAGGRLPLVLCALTVVGSALPEQPPKSAGSPMVRASCSRKGEPRFRRDGQTVIAYSDLAPAESTPESGQGGSRPGE